MLAGDVEIVTGNVKTATARERGKPGAAWLESYSPVSVPSDSRRRGRSAAQNRASKGVGNVPIGRLGDVYLDELGKEGLI